MKRIAAMRLFMTNKTSQQPDRTLATDNAGFKIGLYDLNAIETAEIASTLGDSTVTALNVVQV